MFLCKQNTQKKRPEGSRYVANELYKAVKTFVYIIYKDHQNIVYSIIKQNATEKTEFVIKI